MKTLILSLGNPLRADDGVGKAVLDALATQDLPEHITLLDGGTSGLEMLLLWQGYDHVIIVDAAAMGKQVGEWAQFTAEAIRQQSRDMYLRGTVHYAGLAEAIALAKPMGLMPPQLDIFGIEPESIDWEIGMCEAVVAAIPDVCDAVLGCAFAHYETLQTTPAEPVPVAYTR
jgi:hydrogenase maturation protease